MSIQHNFSLTQPRRRFAGAALPEAFLTSDSFLVESPLCEPPIPLAMGKYVRDTKSVYWCNTP
jgi:hypothetical protein